MGEQNKLVKFSRRNNKSSLGGIYIVKKLLKGGYVLILKGVKG